MTRLVGQTLGGYRVVSQIGQGGMATIYKAYQPSLDRYVALKVLPSYLSEQDDAFTKRFEREARSIAKLRHPNILMVHDSGEHQDIRYIVMEYVDAGTFKDNLSNQPGFAQAAPLISQVASALDYAHDQGVIHRDVKPSNILLPKPDWALLTDFGLATMVGGSFLTQSGMTVGTPAYISPEQGRGEKVGKESDIYSLGVILYELATGSVPFTAETPMAVVIKHILEPLPLPSSKNPNISEQVERIILKAMAKEPENRFSSAGEMAEALNGFLRAAESFPTVIQTPAVISSATPEPSTTVGEHAYQESQTQAGVTISQEPGPPVEEGKSQPVAAKKPPAKRWSIFAALGGLLVVAAVAAALLLTGVFSDDKIDLGAKPQATRTVEQIRADANAYLTSDDFEAAIDELGTALEQDPSNSDIYMEIAKAYIGNGDFDLADNAIQRALEINPDEFWLQEMAGWLYHEMGNFEKAIVYFENAIDMGGEEAPAMQGIASAYQEMGQPEKAIEILQNSLTVSGDSDPTAYEYVGLQFLEMGEYELAEETFRSALEIDPTLSSSWQNLADVYLWQDDIQGAIAVMQQGIEANPNSSELFEGLGWLYRDAGEYENAIAAFEKVIELDPNRSMAYSGLAEFYFEIDQTEKAFTTLEEALEKFPDQAPLHEAMGRLYQDSGNNLDAIPYFKTAIDLDPFNSWSYINLAWAYLGTGNSDDVYDLLDKAVENSDQDPWLLDAVAQIYLELGDCETAMGYFNQALNLEPNLDSAQQGIDNCGG